ncbi:MAG TPA: carbamoyltransferase [Puia sp.]|nr:carbamoyltransferase [Puia sp.]
MVILGISAFFHDSAAALIRDGEVLAAAQEERFTRIKNDSGFPIRAIAFCLEQGGVSPDELDALVFYDKPLLKLERILESYHSGAPAGLRSFLKAMPVWMKEKMMLRKIIRDELHQWQPFNKKKLRILFTEHHLSHAASAFYVSPFEEAAILTIDGVGEWSTTSIGKGSGKELSFLKEIRFPHSLGLLYSAVTYYCGFEVNAGEYKLMGLAPYGDEGSEQYKDFKQKITDHLVTVYEDGSFFLHQEYFDYLTGLRMAADKKWEGLFGFPHRLSGSALEQQHCNLALAFQRVTEEIVLKLAATARRLTGMNRLCLAGGVALNCVANGRLLDAGVFEEMYIQAAAGDAGGALGAALAAYHIYFGRGRGEVKDKMAGAYLGPAYTMEDVRRICRKEKPIFTEYAGEAELLEVVARHLAEGKIIGWFQGRMEFGPRALGNRSILADARDPGMQKRLNLSIKNREGFRPFAPVIPAEKMHDYLENGVYSPYMLLTRRLQKEYYCELPEGYAQLPMKEKLDLVRSLFPAITHVDGSCRVQTVREGNNERLWRLLTAFERQTGEAMLINTSFNVRDEPIVCTPAEAYACFRNTGMDVLVIENIVIYKTENG